VDIERFVVSTLVSGMLLLWID